MSRKALRHWFLSLALPGALVALAACTDKTTKIISPPPEPTNSALEPGEDPPGIHIAVVSLTGGSGPGGNFRAGDTVRVRYTLTKDDGSDWDITELSRGRGLISGPTFNYQRVIAEQTDLHTASVKNKDGSYTYTFADPIPATYLPPLNDTASFGPGDGELQGQALLSGTYTLGMYFGFDYTVEDESYRDIGNVTFDFLFGSAMALAPRAAVAQENCNQCHTVLQAHGGQRREVTLCLLCHTAGAEDRNVMAAAGGTPGVTIEFKVMIHKIHNGEHLPSVLGIGVNPDGSRNYGVTPKPYEVVGFNNSIHDFSDVAFPVWPSLNSPMPRDFGYSGLMPSEQAQENDQRGGVVACYVCHGDPDGAGPIQAPAEGVLAYNQPSRRACGACHDDIDWSLPYTSNQSTMPLQGDDSTCIQCHGVAGSSIDVTEAHTHPLIDPAFNPGLNFDLMDVAEAGMNDMDGTIDPGEKIALTFTMTDDMGADVDPMDISDINAIFSGPTSNINLVNNATIPADALTGMQPYTINLPVTLDLEYLGDSTGGADMFTTALTPIWTSADTTVYLRTATGGGSSTLTSMAPLPVNYVDVASSAGFARNDYVVIDDGMAGEEYLQIQYVDGNRLWFGSPAQSDYKSGTQFAHMAGASVDEVTLTMLTEGMGNDYTLDPMNGTVIEEGGAFGSGNAVLVSYTSDFVMPDYYPLALNDSPDIDETWGQWTGKSIVDGTYRMALWSNYGLSLMLQGESNSYRAPSTAVEMDVLVGDATTLEPYDLVSMASNCYACHQDIYFHGGNRRGLEACLQCHGTAGSEDRPQYRAANAPATTGLAIEFRQMLHKIHRGADLANASTYEVIGFGLGYPNNFSAHTYEDVEFPDFPDGVKHCQKCHGAGNTEWVVPDSLDHPTEQGQPSRPWAFACGSCHDGAVPQAHIAAQTAGGVETCSFCHGEGKLEPVDIVHKIYD